MKGDLNNKISVMHVLQGGMRQRVVVSLVGIILTLKCPKPPPIVCVMMVLSEMEIMKLVWYWAVN
jgi:hypothetical protein